MRKVIEVKNELEGLRYDLNNAIISGNDPEQLLTMAMTKINNIFVMDQKDYLKLVWKK